MAERVWHFQASDAREALVERRNYVRFLRSACTAESDYDAAMMVFSELVGNVVRHAPGPVQITVLWSEPGAMTLRVADTGGSFGFEPALPPITREGGRGLYIVSELCRHVSVRRSERGNVVQVILPVDPAF
jgi:anti-sigma regulatory factor (Ser/Thr protein kinase)